MYGIPNCVPEYFRSMFEDEAHEYELEMERQERYKRNKEYIDRRYKEGCWIIDFYPDECYKCEYAEEAMPTWEEDDIPKKICSNWRNCPVFKEYVKENWPDCSFEEVCSWHE